MHIRRAKGDLSGADLELEECQIQNLTQEFAEEHKNDNQHCRHFLNLADLDCTSGLPVDLAAVLRAEYEHVVSQVLTKSKVVATTLSTASHNILWFLGFNPEFLVCNESGQFLEGKHMITVIIPLIRSVTLLGDPEQLPPMVISKQGINEGALSFKRSLMTHF
jgi:hypothetical protein